MKRTTCLSSGNEMVFIEFANATEMFEYLTKTYELDDKNNQFTDVAEMFTMIAEQIEKKTLVIATDDDSTKIYWNEMFI